MWTGSTALLSRQGQVDATPYSAASAAVQISSRVLCRRLLSDAILLLGSGGLGTIAHRGMTLMHERMVTPAQLRAGRALIGLSQAELAGRACLSVPTIKHAELDGEGRASEAALAAIRVALESQGVIFIDAGDEGPGVRLRRSGPPDEGLKPSQLTSENDG